MSNDELYLAVKHLTLKLENVERIQEQLLSEMMYVKEDVKILISGTSLTLLQLKETFPTHPVKDINELKTFEDWIQDLDNYTKSVSHYSFFQLKITQGKED